MHEDNIIPHVNCKQCGSNDTRLIRQEPPLTKPQDDNRAAFEAWYCSVFRFGHLERFKHPQYDGDPLPYKLLSCNTAWLAWQAAIEHAKKTMCERS